jgi:hypothetical protein
VFNSPTNFTDPSGLSACGLGKNPDCKPGISRVPLTRARLVEIGRAKGIPYDSNKRGGGGTFNDVLGKRFEDAVLRSTGFPKYTGPKLTPPGSQGVIPEAIRPTIGLRIETRNGVTRTRQTVFPNSSFYEVKSGGGDTFGPKGFRGQAGAYLRLAQNSPAGRAGWPPVVTFITTDSLRVGPEFRREATAAGVVIRRSVVYESCLRPGFFQAGPVEIQNPEVYGRRNVTVPTANDWGRSVEF